MRPLLASQAFSQPTEFSENSRPESYASAAQWSPTSSSRGTGPQAMAPVSCLSAYRWVNGWLLSLNRPVATKTRPFAATG